MALEEGSIEELLESPITSRTIQNIEKLVELTKNYPFVKIDLMSQANGQRIHQLVCQYSNYHQAEKDQNVFTLGEKVSHFYLILKGKVGMYIQKKDPITGEIDPYSYDKVKEVTEGNGFGELSLLNNKPSIVIAKCETNCRFAILSKNRYKNLLSIAGIKYLLNDIGFLSSLPYEKNFLEKLVKLLFVKQQVITFHKGQVVFEEGNAVDNVYLVKFGEFNKMKKVENKPQEIESYWQLPPDEICVNQRKSVPQKAPPKQSNVQIGVILYQDLIGELEILKNLKKRSFSLTCYSQEGQLIVIKRKDFEELLQGEESIRDYLLNRATHIGKMEDAMMQKNQNGTLYNHFFSFENAYKQNRVQSKSNVLDEPPLSIPQSALGKGLSSPRIQLQNSLFTSRKTSIVTEQSPLYMPYTSQIQKQLSQQQILTKQNSLSASKFPQSPKKGLHAVFFPSLPQESEQNQAEDNHQFHRNPSFKEKMHASLSHFKNSTLNHISGVDTPHSPTQIHPLSPRRKMRLNLKLKTKQSFEQQRSLSNEKHFIIKSSHKNQLSSAGIKDTEHIDTNRNQHQDDQNPSNGSSSMSPQKLNSYFQKNTYQNPEEKQEYKDNQIQSEYQMKDVNQKPLFYSNKNSILSPYSALSETNRKLNGQSEEYFTPSQLSTNRGIENTSFPITSEFNLQNLKEILIRQKRKSKTNIEFQKLNFQDNVNLNVNNANEETDKQNEGKPQQKKEFSRFNKKTKTIAGNQHVDPFVKMFHKRLQYNFFQQYGKVDMQNLKNHVMNDALQQLPDVDPSIPSLTDIRLMIEEYLNYKNIQDIKKINQKYIVLQSNVKKSNNSFQSSSNHNMDKTVSEDSGSNKQSSSPSKLVQSMMNNFRQTVGHPEKIGSSSFAQLTEKTNQSDIIQIDNQSSTFQQHASENQKIHQSEQKLSSLNLFKVHNESQSQITNQKSEKIQIVVPSSTQLKSIVQSNQTTTNPQSQPNIEHKIQNNGDEKSKMNLQTKPKTETNFHKKLEYIKYITSDHKLERNNHKKFLNLGSTPSINIKSLNQLSQGNGAYLNTATLHQLDDHNHYPQVTSQKHLRTSIDFNKFNQQHSLRNLRESVNNINLKTDSNNKSVKEQSENGGFLSARYNNQSYSTQNLQSSHYNKEKEDISKQKSTLYQLEKQSQIKQQKQSTERKQQQEEELKKKKQRIIMIQKF